MTSHYSCVFVVIFNYKCFLFKQIQILMSEFPFLCFSNYYYINFLFKNKSYASFIKIVLDQFYVAIQSRVLVMERGGSNPART